jgi:hypothetical protein
MGFAAAAFRAVPLYSVLVVGAGLVVFVTGGFDG